MTSLLPKTSMGIHPFQKYLLNPKYVPSLYWMNKPEWALLRPLWNLRSAGSLPHGHSHITSKSSVGVLSAFCYCNKPELIDLKRRKVFWFMVSEASVYSHVTPLFFGVMFGKAEHHGRGYTGEQAAQLTLTMKQKEKDPCSTIPFKGTPTQRPKTFL
jgi:hypothetical protein